MSDDDIHVTWGTPRNRIASVSVPGSKSELNRKLLLAALRIGETRLQGENDSEDVVHMVRALRGLGVEIHPEPHGYRIQGRGQGWSKDDRLIQIASGAGGTTLRFLMALAAARPGKTIFQVDAQLRRRPFASWLKTLRGLGAQADATPEGFFVQGVETWPSSLDVNVEESSQFLSALVMVASMLSRPMTLHWTGAMVSRPYWKMTLACVLEFGGQVKASDQDAEIFPLSTRADTPSLEVSVEGDASSAAVWLAAKRLGWPVKVSNYPRGGRQADAVLPQILSQFDNPRRTICLRDCPDLAPVLTVLSAMLPGHTLIEGAGHLRHKESNRIETLAQALAEVGILAKTTVDGLEIMGSQVLQGGRFDPRGDHRLVMAAALLARDKTITIGHAEAVNKSYPGFWQHAQDVGWQVAR